MKDKILRRCTDEQLIKELEWRKVNNLTMIIHQDFKETMIIPKRVKKIRIGNDKTMGDYKVMMFSELNLKKYE